MAPATLKKIINLIRILEGVIEKIEKYTKIRKAKPNENYKNLDYLIEENYKKELKKLRDYLLLVLNLN